MKRNKKHADYILNLRVRLNFINKLKTKANNAGIYSLSLHFYCCRRGIRTAHGAVSHDTITKNFGGPPQSVQVPALFRVYPLSPPPRQEGMAAKFHHPTRLIKNVAHVNNLHFFHIDDTKIVQSLSTLKYFHTKIDKFRKHSPDWTFS